VSPFGVVEIIKCPNCGFDNPDDSKFCGQCGKDVLVAAGPIASVHYSQSSRIPKKTIMIVAVIVIAIIIVAAIGVVVLQSSSSSKTQLYANISISLTETATANPLIRLSVDNNGDGNFETVKDYQQTASNISGLYIEVIQNITVALGSSASTFAYRIQVFNGASTLHYNGTQPYETFTGKIVDGGSYDWGLYLNSIQNNNQNCDLDTNYLITT
jgi:flagellar basal body-associated protein FliL